MQLQNRGRRVLLYSHDAMGIGHVRRNLRIARALVAASDDLSVLLVSGAAEGTWYTLPPRIDLLTLPSLRKQSNGHYVSRRLAVPPGELIEIRARTIAAAVESFRPDVMIVDKLPRGVAGELVPALRAVRHHGLPTRCVLGLRDILDDAQVVCDEWRTEHHDAFVAANYDAVWIYGDPAVFDTVAEYRFGPAITAMASYTGYLDQIEADPTHTLGSIAGLTLEDGQRLVLCMCGGGEDGGPLARAFAAAPLADDQVGVILTGPFMPDADRDALRRVAAERDRLRVLEFCPDPLPLLRRADRVVLMGGYNSVSEVLRTDAPALVVPRVCPRTEQLVRAEVLAGRRMLDLMRPEEATPEALGRWLTGPRPAVQGRRSIDFNGLDRIPALLEQLLRPHESAERPQATLHCSKPRSAYAAG